jgi:thiol-disulfide isomerase/thioredoxin
MRNPIIFLVATALCVAAYNSAFGQDPAQNASPSTQKSGSATQAQQQQATADTADQPVSLAELARQARAKKQSNQLAAKSAKLLDDDNMPRGVYAADASTADNSASPNATSPMAGGSPQDQYRGKVVLLDFWASWCGPCRSALPNLKRLQAVYGSNDFVVVSISEDDDESDWRAFVSSHQMNWPQRLDSSGAIQKQFGVNALPTYVLIGRDGNVVRRIVGEEVAQSLVERIGPDLKSALAAKP